MNFHEHRAIEGMHAFLSPSSYSWLNYDDAKLLDTYQKKKSVEMGTRLHAFAAECIRLGQKLPKSNKTLNLYVNDAIGYNLRPEQPLFYSPNAFGTADAINYAKGVLRIHDLKTGETPASMHQLDIYAALFFLEYGRELNITPRDTHMELRIYQANTINISEPSGDDISEIMEDIVHKDKILQDIQREE